MVREIFLNKIKFQELYEPEKIVILYEEINRQNPNDEQCLTHLFMAYVRLRDFKMQQKIAMRLYKDFQNRNYYLWAIMSIFMQVLFDFLISFELFLVVSTYCLN